MTELTRKTSSYLALVALVLAAVTTLYLGMEPFSAILTTLITSLVVYILVWGFFMINTDPLASIIEENEEAQKNAVPAPPKAEAVPLAAELPSIGSRIGGVHDAGEPEEINEQSMPQQPPPAAADEIIDEAADDEVIEEEAEEAGAETGGPAGAEAMPENFLQNLVAALDTEKSQDNET